tara:strand:- start:395 stop:640 length:246 start_codon:yes stop_codon:yes gene_type:complete
MKMEDSYEKKVIRSNIDKDANQSLKRKQKAISGNLIVYTIAMIILCIQSIWILLSVVKQGFLKKEILTKRSDVGFDIIIKS